MWDYGQSDTACRVVCLETLSESTANLQEFCDWIGVDLKVTKEMLRPRNVGESIEWSSDHQRVFDATCDGREWKLPPSDEYRLT